MILYKKYNSNNSYYIPKILHCPKIQNKNLNEGSSVGKILHDA